MKTNDWLNGEIHDLKYDMIKKERQRDANVFSRMMRFLLPLFLLVVVLPGVTAAIAYKKPTVRHKGVFWTCTHCRTSQWQDTSRKDWKGEYYCGNCGRKK